MKVAIFHNVARDDRGRPINFDGYEPGAPMVRVFEYEPQTPGTPEQLAHLAFTLFNADLHWLVEPDNRAIAERYRARRLRSLSVGDVVAVGEIALAVDPTDFRHISGDTFNEVHRHEHGTVPLRDSTQAVPGDE